MANYQDIKGFNIQSKSSDPVPYAQELADNPWGGVWASGGSLNTARKDAGGFGAGATNGIVAGGYGGGGAAAGNYVESYNGTSWTETTELNAGRGWSPAGAGTQTAGFVAGGQPLPPASGYTGITEKWDGSSWTESGDLNIARSAMNAAGTQTAGVGFGGINPGSPAAPTDTEKFNGTAWTEANSMNTARSANSLASRGSPQSSVICVFNAYTEVYNGTNWTETTEVNTSRTNGGGAGESSTSAVIYGGSPGQNIAKTESWDGTSWTEVNDLATGRSDGGTTGGTSQNALYAAGETATAYVANTEEWSFPSGPSFLVEGDMWYNSDSNALKVYGKAAGITSGAWATGGNLNTARGNLGHSGSGTQTASIVYGGNIPPGGAGAVNESYNGTAWTEVGDLPGVRDQMISFGTSTAAIAADGTDDNGTTYITTTTSWNGTSWTTVPANVNTNTRQRGSAGTQTAGLGAAGEPGGKTNNELWDGSAWTEASDVNTGGQQRRGAGTQTAAILVSVYPNSGIHEQWNGTSWTETTDLNTARAYASTSGSQTNAISFGGNPQPKAQTEHWNGTSWTELADLGTYRSDHSATGSAVAALCIGGSQPPGYISATEEWTAVSAVATVTTS
jgi:hypothetical protein